MKLTKVTFTGVDERTDLSRLAALQENYPFAEFGVLLSYDWQENGNRFPAPVFLNTLKDLRLKLSAHFCGLLAVDIARGKLFKMSELLNGCQKIFRRCQLNLKAGEMITELRKLQPIPFMREIIIQMHSPEMCRRFLCGDRPKNASFLLDASGGNGIDTPIDIVTAPGVHIGYAGGIGPDNVAEKLRTLLAYPSDESFWVDMETRVRTDDWLDLDKVEQVLKTCEGLVKECSNYKIKED